MILHTILVLCVMSAMTRFAHTHPNEVPHNACVDMKAKGKGHQFAIPQNSKAPYRYQLKRTTILNTESVEFTIQQKNKGTPFKAFMIQVRDDKSQTPLEPLGTFRPKDWDSRTVTCKKFHDTGSHTNSASKTSVTMFWTPPADYHGTVTFYVTVANTKTVFWSHQKAGVLVVK